MMRKILPFLLIVLSIFYLGVVQVRAETVCFQCHEQKDFSKRFIHKPLVKGLCTACHNPHVARFAGLLQKAGDKLCYSCHADQQKAFQEGITHQPVQQGRCLACHDPHASSTKGLIKGVLAERCFTCHENLRQKYKVAHQPFAKGECSACHWPHNADNPQFLKGDQPGKICLGCHSSEDVRQVHQKFPADIKGCLSCHNPHGSNRKGLMRDVLHAPYKDDCTACHSGRSVEVDTEVCLGCHDEVRGEAMKIHNHFTGGAVNSCTACHSPHAGDEAGLIRGSQKQVCRQCHADTFKKHETSIYNHMAKVDTCSSCHETHGSNLPAMLKGGGNAVCMNCHETQGQFTHPVGEGVLDPRTGQIMDCVSCHNPHGTDFKGQLKLSGARELCVQCHHI